MSIFSSLFGKKKSDDTPTWRVGGVEDFMTLIRVYYQAAIAAQLGIRDMRALPDLRVFKQTLKVPTINNKIGVGERKKCQAMLVEMYGMSDEFFVEVDNSIKRHCRKLQDMQTYLYQFQGFTQDLMMLMGNLMKWKFRLPGFLKTAMRTMVAKQVHEIMTKESWSDDGVRNAVASVRTYSSRLNYSENWMSEFVYNVVILAKKEPQKAQDD